MIPFQNLWVVFSLVFCVIVKILCLYRDFIEMYDKRAPTLTSIPETCEGGQEKKKWVPKKKHEVLKAKYKCLKKLFQIYDASVIGILPEQCTVEEQSVDCTEEAEVPKKSRRKRCASSTKTDASAATIQASTCDITVNSDSEERDLDGNMATAVIRELNMPPCSCTSTQFDSATESRYATTQASKEDVTVHECDCSQSVEPRRPTLPPYIYHDAPKLTRFQCFIQRIFGLRREIPYAAQHGRIYANSDNNIIHVYEKRRRRGLRFRRLRRRKAQSDSGLKSVRSPMILSYVQSVQKNCLTDQTSRQCPMTGCRMLSYGIINYNDHLNLCHLKDRKFICHYCHEGFEKEFEKLSHENEHLGIPKLNLTSNMAFPPSSARESAKKASNTQTDPQTKGEEHEEKLKKIVSFFDKIGSSQHVMKMKKDRYRHHQMCRSSLDTTTDNVTNFDCNSSSGDKQISSCVNLNKKPERRACGSSGDSDVTLKNVPSIACRYCGENFEFRRQLSLHMDLEHRTHEQYSKFHSCVGIVNTSSKRCDVRSEDGKIDIQTEDRSPMSVRRVTTYSTLNQDSDPPRRKSEESLNCDPSTNVIYCTSIDAMKSMSSFVGKGGYKWKPGTKVIRV